MTTNAVNRRVVGSSPTWGANQKALKLNGFGAFFLFFESARYPRLSNAFEAKNAMSLSFLEMFSSSKCAYMFAAA